LHTENTLWYVVIYFQYPNLYDTFSNYQYVPLTLSYDFTQSIYFIELACRIRSSSDLSKQKSCAARDACKAHPGANLAQSLHHCIGCGFKIHSAVLCGLSLDQFVNNYLDCVGLVLPDGRKIDPDDPDNEMLCLCYTCIANFTQHENSSEDDEVATENQSEGGGSIGSFSCSGEEDLTGASIIALTTPLPW
jgi:hypothetical protein